MRSSASFRSASARDRFVAGTPASAVPRRNAAAWPQLFLVAALSWLPALSNDAQSTQYTAPGGGATYELPTAEGVEAEMEAARWRLGPLRIAPWIGLRGLTYEPDVFVRVDGDQGEEVSDVTGSVGAGLTAYLPTGGRVFWIAQVMPEYLFWLDLTDRNELIGRYGAGVVADLNHLRLVADGHRTEEQSIVTLESPQKVVHQRDGVSLDAALELTPSLALAASAGVDDLSFRIAGDVPEGDLFGRLDREERRLAAGLQLQPGDAVRVEAGVELTETDFDPGSRDLSSHGTSPYLEVQLVGNKIELGGRFVYRDLEPEAGSSLVPVEELTGRGRLQLNPGWRFTYGLYAYRHVVFALADQYSTFTDDRVGVDVQAPFGERLVAHVFAESGSAGFVGFDETATQGQREDDVTAFGADLAYEIGEWLTFRAGFDQVSIDSNLDEFDRDYSRVTGSFVLSTGSWLWR